MAIYRPPKPRWPLAVATAVVGVLVGFLGGYLMGDKPPEPTDSISAIKTSLLSASGSLDVASVEYRESVVSGTVERPREYEGALGAVRSSREQFTEVRGALTSLGVERVDAIDDLYDEIEAAMEARADVDEVEEALSELRALLEAESS